MNFKRALWSVLLIEILIIVLVIYLEGTTIIAAQTITRYSGRFSLAIFSIIFIFNRRPGHFDKLIFGEPYAIFAVAHGIYLIEILIYLSQAEKNLIPTRLIGGIVSYLFLFIMPYLVVLKKQSRLLESHFLLIETIFLFYTWFTFFMTYLSRVRGDLPEAGGSPRDHIILLGWISLMMGMKLSSWIIAKPPRSR